MKGGLKHFKDWLPCCRYLALLLVLLLLQVPHSCQQALVLPLQILHAAEGQLAGWAGDL